MVCPLGMNLLGDKWGVHENGLFVVGVPSAISPELPGRTTHLGIRNMVHSAPRFLRRQQTPVDAFVLAMTGEDSGGYLQAAPKLCLVLIRDFSLVLSFLDLSCYPPVRLLHDSFPLKSWFCSFLAAELILQRDRQTLGSNASDFKTREFFEI